MWSCQSLLGISVTGEPSVVTWKLLKLQDTDIEHLGARRAVKYPYSHWLCEDTGPLSGSNLLKVTHWNRDKAGTGTQISWFSAWWCSYCVTLTPAWVPSLAMKAVTRLGPGILLFSGIEGEKREDSPAQRKEWGNEGYGMFACIPKFMF